MTIEKAQDSAAPTGAASELSAGLGAAVIGCIGHDGECCKDRDAEKIDAARYRWLKRQPWVKTKGIHAWGALLDNAIDEARHDAPNVEVTGAARLYRAASSDRRERGRPPGWAQAYARARQAESAQESALATRRLNEARR